MIYAEQLTPKLKKMSMPKPATVRDRILNVFFSAATADSSSFIIFYRKLVAINISSNSVQCIDPLSKTGIELNKTTTTKNETKRKTYTHTQCSVCDLVHLLGLNLSFWKVIYSCSVAVTISHVCTTKPFIMAQDGWVAFIQTFLYPKFHCVQELSKKLYY